MRIENEIKLDFKDVLIRPKRSTLNTRKDVELARPFVKFKHARVSLPGDAIPVFAANMDTTGTFEMAVAFVKEHENPFFVAIHKHYSLDEWTQFYAEYPDVLPYVAMSAGTSREDFDKIVKIKEIVGEKVKMICLDVANGYSEHFVECVKKYRRSFPRLIIIAGNVVTGEMVEELILSGADIVKVGIGGGSVCTTRKKTGVGFPQLSAIIECADAAHGLGGLVMADGGCVYPGDFAKAFGGGADFVMAGGVFAGHDESGGEIVIDEETRKEYKEFYGMSSSTAMQKHSDEVKNYRASEGKTIRVPYRGHVKKTVYDIAGGLRSACTYVGASKLKDLCKRTTFIRVTQQTNDIFGNGT